MKKYCTIVLLLCFIHTQAQELYVYTEPASVVPARSLAIRLGASYNLDRIHTDRVTQRYTPELAWGISKKLMLRAGASFADMHTRSFGWDAAYAYAQYRFLSVDGVHRHFRAAVFAKAAHSRNPFHYDEVSLVDKSGVTAGLVATALAHKTAVSVSVSNTQVLGKARTSKVLYIPERNFQALNYTLSAGYLLLPRQYTDYRQTNLNLYAELLAQQTLDRKTHYIDLAPSVQLIFNSISKLNIGYRFQLSGNMVRMAERSLLVSYEYTFLNAIKKKKRHAAHD
ncbi:MAG: hypothetical protein ABW019_16235 [Chitinophagaceae bacterium]